MGQRFELAEAEEARCAFDRMEAAEDAAQQVATVGGFLERYQVAIELIEAFPTFDQKLRDDVIELAHCLTAAMIRPKTEILEMTSFRGRAQLRASARRSRTTPIDRPWLVPRHGSSRPPASALR